MTHLETLTVPDSWESAERLVADLREQAMAMGGPAAIERQHAKGRLTPRERVSLLVDKGSFREFGQLAVGTVSVQGRSDRPAPADGVVTGWGTVLGRQVIVIADDGTITAGARGHAANRKANVAMMLSKNRGIPLIWFAESSVNRMQHVMGSQFAGNLDSDWGLPRCFRGFQADSRHTPVILAISGQSLGAPSFQAMRAEFTTMARGSSSLALAGPAIVKAAIGTQLTSEELGGADIQSKITGRVDHVGDSEPEAIEGIKKFLDFFPANSGAVPERRVTQDPGDRLCPELEEIVPLQFRRAYDMHRVVATVIDDGQLLEIKPSFARNVICGYARIDGWAVGIVANNPLHSGGVLDPPALRKVTRFVQTCNLYNIPLVFLQDQPGVLPGPQSELNGVIREVTHASDSVKKATVPILTVLIRKCFGFSYLILGSRQYGGDSVVAWPSASISLAGPEAGVGTVLANEERAGTLTLETKQAAIDAYIEDSRARYAAVDGRLDNIIEPSATRAHLSAQLGFLAERGPRSRLGPKSRIDL